MAKVVSPIIETPNKPRIPKGASGITCRGPSTVSDSGEEPELFVLELFGAPQVAPSKLNTQTIIIANASKAKSKIANLFRAIVTTQTRGSQGSNIRLASLVNILSNFD
jgi:hypothetical protein